MRNLVAGVQSLRAHKYVFLHQQCRDLDRVCIIIVCVFKAFSSSYLLFYFISCQSEVFTVDVHLTKSAVPAEETTYKCQAVDLKDVGISMDNDYHLVATKGYIDTVEVMHHIIVYGCNDDGKSRAIFI